MQKDNKEMNHLNDEEIAEYTDGLLNHNLAQIANELKQHVAECAFCKAEVMALADSMMAYEKHLVQKRKKNRLVAYMAAAILFIVPLVYFLFPHHMESNGENIAGNFAPDSFYEQLAGQKLRGPAFRLISPDIGQTVSSGRIRFAWQTEETHLLFSLVNNRGVQLMSKKVNTDGLIFKNDLAPGLYYWKLETPQGLLFVGKFKRIGSMPN